jgi:hypothetical protein
MTLFTVQGLVFLASALLVAGVIIELIRRRHLRESYAMLWLGVSLVLLLFGLFPEIPLWTSDAIGMDYRTFALLVCFLFLTAIVLQFSIVLSRHAETNRQLVQRLALLQERLERMEQDRDGAGAPEPQEDRP